MVIFHYIGIISACLAYWFFFYIIEQAYGSQWSFPNTEQCTSFEYFINEEKETHKMIFKLIKTIQQAKKTKKQTTFIPKLQKLQRSNTYLYWHQNLKHESAKKK